MKLLCASDSSICQTICSLSWKQTTSVSIFFPFTQYTNCSIRWNRFPCKKSSWIFLFLFGWINCKEILISSNVSEGKLLLVVMRIPNKEILLRVVKVDKWINYNLCQHNIVKYQPWSQGLFFLPQFYKKNMYSENKKISTPTIVMKIIMVTE